MYTRDMFCTNCGTQINNSDSKFCQGCGSKIQKPILSNNAEQQITQKEGVETKEIDFYAIPIWKMILLWIVTLGGYSFYWHYRHWNYCKQYNKKQVNAGVRAFFRPLFGFGLIKHLKRGYSLSNQELSGWGYFLAFLNLFSSFIVVGMIFSIPFAIYYQVSVNYIVNKKEEEEISRTGLRLSIVSAFIMITLLTIYGVGSVFRSSNSYNINSNRNDVIYIY